MPALAAVPGALLPGSAWPAYTGGAPLTNPAIYTLTAVRNGSGNSTGGTVLAQQAASTQYVQAQITATLNGAAYDPTGDVVQVAFVPAPVPGLPPNPASGPWQAAVWETDPGPEYWASILVGPANGGVVLGAGVYVLAVRVTDNPAAGVLWSPSLIIT